MTRRRSSFDPSRTLPLGPPPQGGPLHIQRPVRPIEMVHMDPSTGRIGEVSLVIDDEFGHRVIPINVFRLPE